MANLTIDARDAVDAKVTNGKVRAYLSDASGNRVAGHTSSGAIVAPVSTSIPASGQVVLDLVPNADITPANTYYTVQVNVGNTWTFLIEKGPSSETLADALADDPSPLSSAAAGLAIAAHVVDDPAHDAAAIGYTGAVTGATTVEEALDTLESDKATTGYVDDAIDTLGALAVAADALIDLNDVVEPAAAWRWVDDFAATGPTGAPPGWTVYSAGAGAACNEAPLAQVYPGVKALDTGTTSSGVCIVSLDTVRLPGDTVGTFWARVRLPVIDNPASNNWAAYVGMVEGLGTAGYYFTATPSSANWQAVSGAAGTTTDTGVAINTGGGSGSWVWLKIERTASAAVYSIDGVQVASHATSLPGSGTVLRPYLVIAKSVGTTSRTLQVDAVACDYTLDRGTMG